mmetsp:Transcript_24908/g.54162  ORF Transcript_24908/g.54162 Transcript_24908/m.54162 type:complete len:391 (-) Transcript_24908:34-1206(-)
MAECPPSERSRRRKRTPRRRLAAGGLFLPDSLQTSSYASCRCQGDSHTQPERGKVTKFSTRRHTRPKHSGLSQGCADDPDGGVGRHEQQQQRERRHRWQRQRPARLQCESGLPIPSHLSGHGSSLGGSTSPATSFNPFSRSGILIASVPASRAARTTSSFWIFSSIICAQPEASATSATHTTHATHAGESIPRPCTAMYATTASLNLSWTASTSTSSTFEKRSVWPGSCRPASLAVSSTTKQPPTTPAASARGARPTTTATTSPSGYMPNVGLDSSKSDRSPEATKHWQWCWQRSTEETRPAGSRFFCSSSTCPTTWWWRGAWSAWRPWWSRRRGCDGTLTRIGDQYCVNFWRETAPRLCSQVAPLNEGSCQSLVSCDISVYMHLCRSYP